MENIISNYLTLISVLSGIIAILVALSVAYNFYSIYAFNNKLEKNENKFNELSDKIQKEYMLKIDALNNEIKSLKELKKEYAHINYEINNANANLKYEAKYIIEAIYIELKNILHIINNEEHLEKYKEFLDVKCYFIANDLLKYKEDVYVIQCNNMKLTHLRDNIIRIYNEIIDKEQCHHIKNKLTIIFYTIRDVLDAITNDNRTKIDRINWTQIKDIAK